MGFDQLTQYFRSPLPQPSQGQPQHVIDHYIFEDTAQRLSHYIPDIKSKLILDIGCGLMVPQSIQFHSRGYRIIGIDMDIPAIYTLLNNPLGSLYPFSYPALLKEYLQNRTYYRELGKLLGVRLKFPTLDIRRMSADDLKFPDNYFAAVISNATFEHILPVEQAFFELYRVMKKGAIGQIGVHLFPSISGGHCAGWQNPSVTRPNDPPPWHHLRVNDFTIVGTTLNRLREREYRALFGRYFEILEWRVPDFEEGRELLSPEIREELKDYTEEELLRRWILVVFRK